MLDHLTMHVHESKANELIIAVQISTFFLPYVK